MKNEYTILIEKDEDGYYVGSIPALPGCHSQARSVDQLMERMAERRNSGARKGVRPLNPL